MWVHHCLFNLFLILYTEIKLACNNKCKVILCFIFPLKIINKNKFPILSLDVPTKIKN